MFWLHCPFKSICDLFGSKTKARRCVFSSCPPPQNLQLYLGVHIFSCICSCCSIKEPLYLTAAALICERAEAAVVSPVELTDRPPPAILGRRRTHAGVLCVNSEKRPFSHSVPSSSFFLSRCGSFLPLSSLSLLSLLSASFLHAVQPYALHCPGETYINGVTLRRQDKKKRPLTTGQDRYFTDALGTISEKENNRILTNQRQIQSKRVLMRPAHRKEKEKQT